MAIRIAKPSLPPEYYVDNRVYTDRRVFDQEMERIFLTNWNFVCHESEIPEAGDYRTATVAGQAIVVCRNPDGRINAFYNTCRHRGAQVVPEGAGNARAFTCMYHLWTYDLDGRLLSVPGEEAYQTSYAEGGLAKCDTGLVPVRVDSMHRLVFVCFDHDVPGLADYLGDIADVLAVPFGDPELKVWVDREKTMRANWKMQPENSRDGYHAPLLHRRLRHVSPPRPYRLTGNGHAVQVLGLDYEDGLKHNTVDKELADNPELTRAFMSHPLPGISRDAPAYVVTLFPDSLFLVRYSTLLIERQIPIGPDETVIEFRAGGIEGDDAAVSAVRDAHWNVYWSDGEGNLAEDWAAYEAQQRGVGNAGMRYSLLARGEPATEGLRGDDNRIRGFWHEWRGYMGADTNAPPDSPTDAS
jgi:methanesulfonate monooxygenase large subunit